MQLPSLRVNIVALSGLQLANYLIPLVAVPYLARTLGVVGWGRTVFVLFVLQFLVILTNFGFTWSAVSQIAATRHDSKLVSEIFCATWVSQWMLLGLSAISLAIIVVVFPVLRQEWDLYLAGFAIVIGNVLFPVWLLQGLERLREVAVIQVISKSVLLIPLFILVNTPDDVALAIFLQSSSGLLAGTLCLYWMASRKIVRWRMPNSTDVLRALKRGSTLFLSKVWISFYSTMIPVLLGLLAGPAAVGIYGLAEKVQLAATYVMNPVSEALFPRMSLLISKDHSEAKNLFKKSLLATVFIAGFVSGSLFIWADWIVSVIGGEEFSDASSVLRYMSVLPLLVGLSNVFGVQVMIPMERTKAFNWILATAGILSLTATFPLATYFGAIGAAASKIFAELLVAFLMLLYLKKYKLFQ